jgi:hypothetical protein
LKNALFRDLKIVCRIYDTTAPTKEGLLCNDKIVSNLPEQISGKGYRNQRFPSVWCAAFNVGASWCGLSLFFLPPKVNAQ